MFDCRYPSSALIYGCRPRRTDPSSKVLLQRRLSNKSEIPDGGGGKEHEVKLRIRARAASPYRPNLLANLMIGAPSPRPFRGPRKVRPVQAYFRSRRQLLAGLADKQDGQCSAI